MIRSWSMSLPTQKIASNTNVWCMQAPWHRSLTRSTRKRATVGSLGQIIENLPSMTSTQICKFTNASYSATFSTWGTAFKRRCRPLRQLKAILRMSSNNTRTRSKDHPTAREVHSKRELWWQTSTWTMEAVKATTRTKFFASGPRNSTSTLTTKPFREWKETKEWLTEKWMIFASRSRREMDDTVLEVNTRSANRRTRNRSMKRKRRSSSLASWTSRLAHIPLKCKLQDRNQSNKWSAHQTKNKTAYCISTIYWISKSRTVSKIAKSWVMLSRMRKQRATQVKRDFWWPKLKSLWPRPFTTSKRIWSKCSNYENNPARTLISLRTRSRVHQPTEKSEAIAKQSISKAKTGALLDDICNYWIRDKERSQYWTQKSRSWTAAPTKQGSSRRSKVEGPKKRFNPRSNQAKTSLM